MTGADLVVKALAAHGVTFLSTLCGNGIDPILIAAHQQGLRIVDVHNEQTASYMAETYGRFTRRVGVCAVSSSVGFTNALIGMVNASFDGAPMLLISGASDHAFADRGNFQDFDQIRTATPICKYTRFVDRPDKIPFYVHEAMAVAVGGRPGPVHLTIPLDVLGAAAPESPDALLNLGGAGVVNPICAGPGDAVERAAAAIAKAVRPLLVVGSGAYYAQADERLARFAAQTGIPIVTPIWDRGSIATPLPQFMGVIGSASGSPRLLDTADLVILAGARVDYRIGYLQPPATRPDLQIIRISADSGELLQGVEPHIAIHGDPASVLGQLSALLPARPTSAQVHWLQEAQRRNQEFRQRWSAPLAMTGRPITGHHLVEALRPFVQGDTTFVIDGGNIGQWAHMVLCDRYPGHWMTCGASGVIGFGIGGAMAAKLAFPSRPVILLSGDGSMGFNLADLESATRQHLPFVAIVADDQAWGIVVSGQTRRLGPDNTVACKLGPIQFAQVAEACGAIGVRVEEVQEIGPAVEKGLTEDRPVLIHVPLAQGGPAD